MTADVRLTPRARAEWADRAGREYGSGAVAHHFTLWLIQLGASPDLIRAGLDVVEDELRHAEMCHHLVVGAGPGPAATIPREALELTRRAEVPLEHDVLRVCLGSFCLNETIAVTMFQAMRRRCTVPQARATVEEFLADEVTHREFGWVTLEWLLRSDTGPELRALVLPELRAMIASRSAYYNDPEQLAAAAPITTEDRAWGVLARDEYPEVFARTVDRDVRPRLARLGVELL